MVLTVTIENEDTGGGCIATLITLPDGRVLVTSNISGAICTVRGSRKEWEHSEDYPEPPDYPDLTTAIEAIESES